MKATITADELKRLLHYDPHTGLFKWKLTGRGHRSHLIAGSRNKFDGYVKIYIRPHRYAAHQLAWLYMKNEIPRARMDHVNGVRHDNRIDNLRLATATQNSANHKVRVNCPSGVSGVSFSKERGGKWIVVFNLPYKTIRKRFDIFEDAVSHRRMLERLHYGAFAPERR